MEKRNSLLLVGVLLLVVAVSVGLGLRITRNTVEAGGDGNWTVIKKIPKATPTTKEPVLGALPGNESGEDFIFRGQVLAGLGVNQPVLVNGTTTKNVYLENGRDRVDSVARWTNTTGKALVCTRAQMPLFSSSDTWTFSFGVGTTTRSADGTSWTNTTTATLVASTTAANTADVIANNFNLFTTNGNAGSYFTKGLYGTPTTTDFYLAPGVSIIGWMKTINATSSDGFVRNDGNKITGTLSVDCVPVRY